MPCDLKQLRKWRTAPKRSSTGFLFRICCIKSKQTALAFGEHSKVGRGTGKLCGGERRKCGRKLLAWMGHGQANWTRDSLWDWLGYTVYLALHPKLENEDKSFGSSQSLIKSGTWGWLLYNLLYSIYFVTKNRNQTPYKPDLQDIGFLGWLI